VMDEQDPLPVAAEDERGRGHVAGKGATGMDVVPARDLTAQTPVPPCRQAEGFRMPVEDRCDMAAEGGRIEAGRRDIQGRQPSITLAKASLYAGCQRDRAGRFATMSSAAQRMRFSSISRVVSLSGHRM